MIKEVEEQLGKPLKAGKVMMPLDPGYHPEVDTSPLLDDDRTNYYQSMIGLLLWATKLGCIDVTQEVGLMARFGALPLGSGAHVRLLKEAFTLPTRVRHEAGRSLRYPVHKM